MLQQQSPIELLSGIILLGLLFGGVLAWLRKNANPSSPTINQTQPKPDSASAPVVATTPNDIQAESPPPMEPESSRPSLEYPNDNKNTQAPKFGAIYPTAEIRDLGDYRVAIHRFQIPKQGITEAECEDKSALSSPGGRLRVAVADGATESIFSDIWADLIVKHYVDKGVELLQPLALESLSQTFFKTASKLIAQMPETRHWFMYEKLERGSHVTFAAVDFFPQGKMQVVAVGDSCVFWRNEEDGTVEMLPELSAEDFGAFPASICNLQKTWEKLNQKIVKKEVALPTGFQIVLCTDALACWLVKELQKEQKDRLVWKKLFQLSDSRSFTQFIEGLRSHKEIRNDDVTLVLIHAIPIDVRLP